MVGTSYGCSSNIIRLGWLKLMSFNAIARSLNPKEENKIVTTIDELNSYAIVKSILRKEVEPQRIVYKDTESYFGILLDNNIRKWILRINLNSRNKHIIIPSEDKKKIRYDIETIDDIYNYENEIIEALKRYM